MKAMKKITVLLLIAALMASAAIPALAASAYTAVTVGDNLCHNGSSVGAPDLKHRLTLTNDDTLPYNVVYNFTVGNVKHGTTTQDGDLSQMVSNSPTIRSITHTAGVFADKDTENKYYQEVGMTVSWSGVQFKQPGIYEWPVTETATPAGGTDEASTDSNVKLIAVVIDDNGQLKVAHWYMNSSSNNKSGIKDTYPVSTLTFDLTKQVAGDKASKDRYFEFTVKIDLPTGATSAKYTLDGTYEETTETTPWNDTAYTNPTKGDETVNSSKIYMVYLKHGQKFEIKGLPKGAKYTVTETSVTDYTPTASGGVLNAQTAMNNDVNMTVTNTRNTATPTGILLQVGAPLTGLVLAAALLSVILATKRRKEQEAK